MPEATATHSRTAARRQPRSLLAVRIQDDFEEVSEMLRAYSVMTTTLFESTLDHSNSSYGMHLIHKLIMARLDEVAADASVTVTEAYSTRQIATPPQIDADVLVQVHQIVASVFEAAGETVANDGGVDLVSYYYNQLLKKLDGSADLLEVGSLMPWLEMKIRKDLGVIDTVERVATRLSEEEEEVLRKAG